MVSISNRHANHNHLFAHYRPVITKLYRAELQHEFRSLALAPSLMVPELNLFLGLEISRMVPRDWCIFGIYWYNLLRFIYLLEESSLAVKQDIFNKQEGTKESCLVPSHDVRHDDVDHGEALDGGDSDRNRNNAEFIFKTLQFEISQKMDYVEDDDSQLETAKDSRKAGDTPDSLSGDGMVGEEG